MAVALKLSRYGPREKDLTTGAARAATPNQTRYVHAELAGAGSYMIPMGHVVSGPFDEARFVAAASALVARHAALRSVFSLGKKQVTVAVAVAPSFYYATCALSEHGLAAFRDWALPLVFEDVDPFRAGSLIRFFAADYGDTWRFIIAGHHAITDGFSRGVMNRELLQLYVGETLDPVTSYYDFGGAADAPGRASLYALIGQLPEPVEPVAELVSTHAADLAGQFVERDFTSVSRAVRTLAKSSGATRFAVLCAAYALSLSGQTGRSDLSTFFQSEGRKSVGASNSVVGPFSNTLPLDLSFTPDMPFEAMAQTLSRRIADVLATETQPVMEALHSSGKAPLVSINHFPPAGRIKAGELEIGPRFFLDRRTEYALNLVWSDDNRSFLGRAFYDANRLSKDRADLFLALHERILETALQTPQANCREILKQARAADPSVFPQQDLSVGPQARLHEPVFAMAARTPDADAIVTTQGRVNYRALRSQAGGFHAGLAKAGVQPGDRVAILARRCPEMVAAILGVSVAGGSFAVLDASYPVVRLEKMLALLKPRFLLEVGDDLPCLATGDVVRVPFLPDAEPPEPVTGPSREVAYHLFTSGTTGTPKLVSHPELTLQRFLRWQAEWLGPEARLPTTLMLAGLSHDPVLRDIFLPLTTGGAVAIPAESEMSEPCTLRSLMETAGVTVLHVTPAGARLLTAGQSDPLASPLEALFWGGDRVSARLVETWQGLSPGVRQVNLYGATETPQGALIHELGVDRTVADPVPVGRPMPWTGARLVGSDGDTVGLGEVGEIVIDLSEPVAGAVSGTGEGTVPCHHTGDRGYALSDGAIRFVGRMTDGQVKINGYRVELAEIEATAERFSGVDTTAVVFDRERNLLGLFVVCASDAFSATQLQAELSAQLPGHMVPARIERIDQMPLTQNAKVDRAALLDRMAAQASASPDGDFEAPATPEEARIAAIFARHTGAAEVSRSQSLDMVGADSLSQLEVRLALEAEGVVLPRGWEWLPIRELAPTADTTLSDQPKRSSLFGLVSLETSFLMRAIAITSIVMFHFGFMRVGGASTVLMSLAGVTAGLLMLPAVLKDGRTGRVWALCAKLLIPLVPASILLYGVYALTGRDPHISTLLMVSNFAELVDVQVLGVETYWNTFPWLWFLHAYVQIFLLMAVLLSLPRFHGWLARDTWRGVLICIAVLEVSTVLLFSAGATLARYPDLIAQQLAWTFPFVLPYVLLGVLVAIADTPQRKGVALALCFFHFALHRWVFDMHPEWYWLGCMGLFLALPVVKAPRLLAAVALAISANALMIYLSHTSVDAAVRLVFGDGLPNGVRVAVALACGIALGMLVRPVIAAMGVNRLANKRIVLSGRGGDINLRSGGLS